MTNPTPPAPTASYVVDAPPHDLRPFAVQYHSNPSQQRLREMTLKHTPYVFQTQAGSLVKYTRNKARMAKYTHVVAPAEHAERYSHQLMSRERADQLIARQRAYIEEKGELIEVQGYLGLGRRAVGVQWLYTVEGANIAGMQSVLRFPVEDVLDEPSSFQPIFQIVYTPNLFLDDMPGKQAIIVDLANFRTHIIGPDYFGESKKAALRMLNELAFRNGGLTLHAGAKLVHVGGSDITMTIMGLSGTGKTTTTFSKQGTITQPIQDDMVTLWPDGEMSITENGCFAKTYGLTEATEPTIFRSTMSSEAWLENVYLEADGTPDFFKADLAPSEVARLRDALVGTGAPAVNVDRYISGEVSIADVCDEQGILLDGWDFVRWTANGRSILPMSSVEEAADLKQIPTVRTMGILNRDEGADAATPGIVRFTSPAQAAGYFMLGETTKTSAAGKEVGKTRSPFTQPFFPRAFGLQAGRFSELAATMPGVDLWLMNTGYVGGDQRSVAAGSGMKVKIRHSSAMLEALLAGRIVWRRDPDFGYDLVDIDAPENAALLEQVPSAILDPSRHFAEKGQADVHSAWVQQMKSERRAFLESYAVATEIIEAVCG